MDRMLPERFSNPTYWKDIHTQPLPYWSASLERINLRHFREGMRWERAALGRNIVFLSEEWVLKLSPPGWVDELEREASALGWVPGRLPVRTPELVHTGRLGAWGYLVQRRLPGQNLRELWQGLDTANREQLAFQHGEILAALHALPLPGLSAGSALAFGWAAMLADQRAACAGEMARAGVPQALVDRVEGYLEAAAPVWQAEAPRVLLHGDLTHLNLLVEPAGAALRITGLIDWGDAKLGPPGHEFISPGVHMYLGDRAALAHFYAGCGQAGEATRPTQEVMARAMLYYAGDFAHLLGKIPEAAECQDWDCVARMMF
jgi:hygromycin-B 7''-O-kinase